MKLPYKLLHRVIQFALFRGVGWPIWIPPHRVTKTHATLLKSYTQSGHMEALSFIYMIFYICRIRISCTGIWNLSLKYTVAKCAMLFPKEVGKLIYFTKYGILA